MNFFSNFIKSKASDVKDNLTEMLARWDPETATQAEVDTMYDEFVNLSKKLEKARQTMEREQAEAETIKKAYNKKMDILDVLQTRKSSLDENSDPSVEREIDDAIAELTSTLEDLMPDVEREIEEAKEAKEYFDELSSAVKDLGDKIKTARSSIEKAKKRMERAELNVKKAKEREERAKELAGLKNATKSTGAAFDALTRAAEKMEADAAAANNRTKLLGDLNTSKKTNSLISEIESSLSDTKSVERPKLKRF